MQLRPGSIPRTGRRIPADNGLPGKEHFCVMPVADGIVLSASSCHRTEDGITCQEEHTEENICMSQTKRPPSLSEYERFVLESLYRQAAEEEGHPPGVQVRQRIREEYIVSLGKDTLRTGPYRKHKKSGDTENTFQWKPTGPMRTIRKVGE
ncbi:hypothetical protein LHS21_004673 [Salmonella enterica subsp. enterica serovar Newport]|nr:hypothetical protein [Salmonella enterica subsp. enterica serovar Newport]